MTNRIDPYWHHSENQCPINAVGTADSFHAEEDLRFDVLRRAQEVVCYLERLLGGRYESWIKGELDKTRLEMQKLQAKAKRSGGAEGMNQEILSALSDKEVHLTSRLQQEKRLVYYRALIEKLEGRAR